MLPTLVLCSLSLYNPFVRLEAFFYFSEGNDTIPKAVVRIIIVTFYLSGEHETKRYNPRKAAVRTRSRRSRVCVLGPLYGMIQELEQLSF